jgi:hypothetical protein
MLRWLIAVCALVGAVAVAPVDARASVSIAVTWDALLRESTVAAVATPVESRCVWEDGRIYTYTRLRIDRVVAGETVAGNEAWVRTMGGVVGTVGQLVDGEPVLAPGQSSLLFLHPGPVGALEVTARGQGQFPIVTGDRAPARLVRSTSVGALVAPRPPSGPMAAARPLAADVVHGRPVDDVARDVASAWSRAHAR